jgi:surface antigen
MARGVAAAMGLVCLTLAACNGGVGGGPDASIAAPSGGGLAGGAIGKDLSLSDQRAARAAEYKALEYGHTGVPVEWKNGNNHGEVVPGASYRVNAYTCRDFVHTIYIGTAPQSARSTACRQANGNWQPVT